MLKTGGVAVVFDMYTLASLAQDRLEAIEYAWLLAVTYRKAF